jgi:hypothetical protein
MAGAVKTLQFSEGTTVSAPSTVTAREFASVSITGVTAAGATLSDLWSNYGAKIQPLSSNARTMVFGYDGAGNLLIQGASNSSTTQPIALQLYGGSVGIGTAPSHRTHIKGAGATGSTYALFVQNSTPTTIFSVRDDGDVQIGRVNTNSHTLWSAVVGTGGRTLAGYLELTLNGNTRYVPYYT